MNTSTLPRRHPVTGAPFAPVGHRKNGRPIYPVLGGSGQDLLENLTQQFESCRSLINGITLSAAEQNRGLSEQDSTTIEAKQEQMRGLQKQIDLLKEQEELNRHSAGNLAMINRGPATAAIEYRSVGELIRDRLDAASDPQAAARYSRSMTRAAQHMGTTAANTVATAGGMPGLIIAQNVGPIIDVNPKGRPLLTALGVTPSSNPMNFQRPKLVDENFETGAAEQAKEKQELVSQKFDIEADTVSLKTVGGYLNISAQLQAMPIGALDKAFAQLQRRVAFQTELRAATALLTGADTSVTLAAGGTGSAFLDAVYDASAKVYEETGELATFIAMSATGWARVGKFKDADERQYFPTLGATNAAGTMSAASFQGGTIAGLQPIVTPGLRGANVGDFVVGNELALEAYEYAFPLFQSPEPSVLGTQIAVATAFGTHRPVAGAAVVLRPAPAGAARTSSEKKD